MVRFHVLTAASMKLIIFWDILLYSLIETDQYFRVSNALIIRVMKAVSTPELSVSFYKTAWCNIQNIVIL
jgi:hypothetical protein